MSLRYQLFYPTRRPQDRSTMLDYIMGEQPKSRDYVQMDEGVVNFDGKPVLVPEACTALWYRYNMGNEDGSYAYSFRSMCIGDILVFPTLRQVVMVDRVGFTPLAGDDIPAAVAKAVAA
jgi:hypothetical protein